MAEGKTAREVFLDTTFKYPTRTVANFSEVLKLGQMLVMAEDAGFKLDTNSVEKAVENLLNVGKGNGNGNGFEDFKG